MYEPTINGTLHAEGAPEIWINQSGFCRRGKLYCPDVKCMIIEVEHSFSLETAVNGHGKSIFFTPKAISHCKEYVTFCVFNLLFGAKKGSPSLGNSLFDRCRQVGSCVIIDILNNEDVVPRRVKQNSWVEYWKKPKQLFFYILLAVKKKTIIVSFWLPPVLQAQAPYARQLVTN